MAVVVPVNPPDFSAVQSLLTINNLLDDINSALGTDLYVTGTVDAFNVTYTAGITVNTGGNPTDDDALIAALIFGG
jgi:hypothetical protein